MFSLLFAIGRKSIQFNIYKSVKDLSKNINQNDIKKLLVMLKHEKYSIDISNKTILNQLTKYLNQNIFILTLLKNSNEKNKYITKIIANILCEEVFVNKIK